MKFYSKFLISLCFIALLNVTTVMKANAGQYLGDFCWNFTMTINGSQSSGIIKLGVEHIGGGHCLCSGVMTVTSPIVMPFTTFGNLEFLDNEIRVTTSLQAKYIDKQNNTTVGINMTTATLNPNTLNGTFEGFGVTVNGTEASNGTVTFTSCP